MTKTHLIIKTILGYLLVLPIIVNIIQFLIIFRFFYLRELEKGEDELGWRLVYTLDYMSEANAGISIGLAILAVCGVLLLQQPRPKG